MAFSIAFEVHCSTQFGENVFVVGSSDVVGNWNPENALPLLYTVEDKWKSSPLTVSGDFEYKYIIKTSSETKWEQLHNRTFSALQTNPNGSFLSVVLSEKWNQDGREVIPVSNVTYEKAPEPVQQPAEQPVQQPAEQPVEQPVEQHQQPTHQEAPQQDQAPQPESEGDLEESKRLKDEGNRLFTRQQFDQSVELYTKAIKLSPAKEKGHLSVLHANRALSFVKLSKYNEAIEDSDKSLEFDPEYYKALYRKGLALQNQAKYHEALRTYEEVLTKDPENKDTRKRIEECNKALE